MQRALLMMVLFSTILVPAVTSRDKKPARGMKRTVIIMCVLIVIWGYSCRTYYYRLGE
ncbi:MAG TPA: hypothetical protein VH062_13885 [Polyangiaceae bacterium]|nr:hypothetical protein [Polyangiaceae bacterium]